jgi:Ca2+-binding EF-hand superfamily protein
MKTWFVWALVALMAVGVQAAEKGKSKGKDGGGFAAMDADKDGKLTLKEFVAASKARADKAGKEFKEEDAKAAFAKKDANKDGVLTADEMSAAAPSDKKAKAKKPKASDGDDGE